MTKMASADILKQMWTVGTIKWKILLVLQSSFIHTRWLFTKQYHAGKLFITSIGDSYDNGKTIKNVTL